MFGLFSGLGWSSLLKLLAVVAVIGVIGGTIYAGYRYVENLQDENTRLMTENATLIANNAQLEQAIKEQQDTIASLERDIELQGQILTETNNKFQLARDQVRALIDRLGKHELGYLAYRRPGLVENIVNNATDDVGRCFEIATGAPLTEEELNATLPSQINRECPDLANPNYRGD